MNIRQTLIDTLAKRDSLSKKITTLQQQYLNEYTDYIYITDHAIIRYLERVMGIGTHTFEGSENERVTQYLKIANMSGQQVRDKILSHGEQRTIVQQGIKRYRKDDMIYVIANLSLVTVLQSPE